jgi:hypothetical protein
MADIYRAVYAGKHYLIGIAVSNLGVAMERSPPNAYRGDRHLLRDAVAHPFNGHRTHRLDALLRDGRPAEAEPELWPVSIS